MVVGERLLGVAAGAVVVHDVSPYEIVGGVPARVIRRRFPPDVAENLLEERWWDRDLSELAEIADRFQARAAQCQLPKEHQSISCTS